MASTMHCSSVQCLAPFRSGYVPTSKASSPAARKLQVQCGELVRMMAWLGPPR